LCFKGDRDYLHGTDIVREICETVVEPLGPGVARSLIFNFHRLARTGLEASLGGVDASRAEEAVATATFDLGSKRLRVTARETGTPVDCRYPYDENSIVRACEFDAQTRSATLRSPPPFSFIELVVAANKALHLRHLPGPGRKWLFVRGEFDRYRRSTNGAALRVTLARYEMLKLTKSALFLGDDLVGYILFTVN
jgi:hypothetical protein